MARSRAARERKRENLPDAKFYRILYGKRNESERGKDEELYAQSLCVDLLNTRDSDERMSAVSGSQKGRVRFQYTPRCNVYLKAISFRMNPTAILSLEKSIFSMSFK